MDPHIWAEGGKPKEGESVALRSDTFVQISRQANPAVVSIFTQAPIQAGIRGPLGLFRVPFLNTYATSLGSGFIIHPQGFIVTNAHVIAGAAEISVFLHQQREARQARVVGVDKVSDLALLKIEADRPLAVIPLARSVETGEFVVAVGNPYGLSHSLTMGVISAKERQLDPGETGGGFEDLLQTSAQINPGNSGGPLLNLRGEAVGVNTAMIENAQGIGFAVPSDTVREVIPGLVRDGEVVRSWLGLQFDIPSSLDQPGVKAGPGGVTVRAVARGGPADSAGIRPGDIIVEYNGRPVPDPREFVRTISRLAIGSEVSLVVIRGESRLRFTVRTVRMR